MKNVLLNPNPSRDINLECTKKVVSFFKERGINVYISNEADEYDISGAIKCDLSEAASFADIIISFGGDGTLLHTASQVAHLGVPILGINIGRIGYMAELESNELCYLENIIEGNYSVEERMMIDVSVRRNNDIVFSATALNDAVINKSGLVWIVDMDIYADSTFISRYSGDGVIIATPTGSTAYSLSAGGPIIDPIARNIIITPICTHALAAKPIVLSEDRVINVLPQNDRNGAIVVSVDGANGFELIRGDSLEIKLSENVTKLIHVKNTNFYDVLYSKLSDRRFD